MTDWQEIVLPGGGKLGDLVLLKGNHAKREQGVCVLEAVVWLAGEEHSDQTDCACPVIAAFLRVTNDRATDEQRQELRPYIPALVGSKAGRKVTVARGFVAADYAVRVFAPLRLEYHGRKEYATLLRGLTPITDKASAVAARDAAREVYRRASVTAAYAAVYAAVDAAVDAAALKTTLWPLRLELIDAMLAIKEAR